jgi:hypothetical protein
MSGDDFREQVSDLLAYLDLHIGRYQWKVLTAEQKELMADLVDESERRSQPDDPRVVERWWRA